MQKWDNYYQKQNYHTGFFLSFNFLGTLNENGMNNSHLTRYNRTKTSWIRSMTAWAADRFSRLESKETAFKSTNKFMSEWCKNTWIVMIKSRSSLLIWIMKGSVQLFRAHFQFLFSFQLPLGSSLVTKPLAGRRPWGRGRLFFFVSRLLPYKPRADRAVSEIRDVIRKPAWPFGYVRALALLNKNYTLG